MMMYTTIAATLIIPFFVQPFSTITTTTTAATSPTTASDNAHNNHNHIDSVFTVHDKEVVIQGQQDWFAATGADHHDSESLVHDDKIATSQGESLPALVTVQNQMNEERKEVDVSSPYILQGTISFLL